jgi:quercetin dioxygenase-like cupin family protein
MSDAAPIRRTPLATPRLEAPKLVERVQITEIVLEPGQATGAHTHPIPVVGYIVRGRIRFQIDAQPPHELQAGQAFYEPAETPILHFDNASLSEPATFVACYLLGQADHELILPLPS